MKILIALGLIGFSLLDCSVGHSSTNHFKLADVIPTGDTTVEVLELRFSARTEELALKLTRALATNQVWWLDYMKAHVDERPLPYHTNFGLSRQEWNECLDGGDKTRYLRKASDAIVRFKRQGDFLTIDIGDAGSPVQQGRLNLSTGELYLITGEVIKPEWRVSDDATQPIGTYEGYNWKLENGTSDLSNVSTLALWIYRLKPNGMIFWRIQDGKIKNNKSVRSLDLKFRYYPHSVKKS